MEYYLAYSKTPEVRHYSTSGGFTKEVLAYALRTKLVSKAVFVRMNGIKSEVVVTDDPQELFTPATNSIYDPISPLAGLKQLGPEETCATTLLPCHVEVAPRDKCKLIIELLCGRTPLPEWTTEVLDAQGVKPEEVRTFYYRTGTWPGYGVIELHDGRSGEFSFVHAWPTGENDTQPAKCLTCRRISLGPDIVVSDPWGLFKHFDRNEPGKTLVHVKNRDLLPWLHQANIVLEPISEHLYQYSIRPHVNRKRART
ncbi:coenzyme F420 hydrogenase/dehydrogenase beta subunit N-terminal domain-containing protein [Bremerella alba]|uniref:Uncharacterized protein n=1 Tax=Bremerella alba TaxID=980252 RepID=A0A7V9A752_9BACT|nr:coenzyme F420 hydrogenase/dehydrogenase beta subunit N-terminal domain-containing protein [Bremerella alba]MBA2115012.1 hypothetical protein [Bremerella alba]